MLFRSNRAEDAAAHVAAAQQEVRDGTLTYNRAVRQLYQDVYKRQSRGSAPGMRKISIKQLWSSGRSLQPTNLPSCLPATHAPCPASPVVGLTPPPSVQKPRIIDQFAPTRPVKPYTDVFVERETTGGTKGRQWADSSERRRTATW